MSSGSGQTAFEERGRNPPDANLYHIAKDLLQILNGVDYLDEAKKQILDRYEIVTQIGHNCWSADVIEKAWKETKIMGEKPSQEHWASVIMVQMIKSLICDKCKQNQKLELTNNVKTKCGLGSNEIEKCRKEHPEDIPSQSKGNPQTSGQTDQGCTGTPNTVQSQSTGNNPADSNKQDGPAEALSPEQNYNRREGGTIYIRVPLSEMIHNEKREEEQLTLLFSQYKLLDQAPTDRVTDRDSILIKRKPYVMSFNRETGNANWVYEILNKNTLADNRVGVKTFEDPYHKGHLVAVANHRWCREALDDANMFINIVPQHHSLNKGPWKRLENYCRTRARDPNTRNVHVYSGPIYLRDMIPKMIENKRVPSHFFKVIIEEKNNGTLELQCHQTPNEELERDPDNQDYLSTTIEDIQRDSGLTFRAIRPDMEPMDREIKWTLQGEDGNTVPQAAEIQVMISPLNSI